MALPWKVYKTKLVTVRGTTRVYVGHLRSEDVRKSWMQKKPPVFMRCQRETSTHSFEILESNLASRADAAFKEVLWAAQEIKKDRWRVRGGPWLTVKLGDAQFAEVEKASVCKDLQSLQALAREWPGGPLAWHMELYNLMDAGSGRAGGVKANTAQDILVWGWVQSVAVGGRQDITPYFGEFPPKGGPGRTLL